MRDDLIPLLDAHFAEFNGPFDWVTRDCARLAAGWVKKVNGLDIIAGLKWHSQETALATLKANKWRDVRDLFGAQLEAIPITRAIAGDLVARLGMLPPLPGKKKRTEFDWAMGICTGARSMFLDPAGVLVEFDTLKCGAAWAVNPPPAAAPAPPVDP